MSLNVEQNRSTLLSSRGASTSSKTQIGAGFVKNAENIKANAVRACSPPKAMTLFEVFPGWARHNFYPGIQWVVSFY